MGPSKDLVAKAAENLDKFAFAGITEVWDLSLCLFHRLMGSAMQKGDSQISNVQPGDGQKPAGASVHKYDSGLGFVDVADELVFKRVLDKFEAELKCVLDKLKAGKTDTQNCAVQPVASTKSFSKRTPS